MKKAIQKAILILAGSSIIVACNPLPDAKRPNRPERNRLTIKNQKKMFTLAQIKEAHSKVKSGADFPAYIRAIKQLGVTHYESYVSDGHVHYHGANNYTTTVPPKYDPLTISEKPNIEQFKADLKAHQQGQTDYLTFIHRCAGLGIEKWEVSLTTMTCTYFDKAGNEVLVEQIPQ